MAIEGWNIIDEGAGVLWREYPFSKSGRATTLVFRGAGGLVVVSPGPGLDARAYDALRDFGEVKALVANNSFHHMGQRPWRDHFPDAASYCPPHAVQALDKKQPGLGFRPLDALDLGASARWDDPPGYKTGEAILSVTTSKGAVWYSGDLLTNIPQVPGPPLRWLFTWTDSGPGFKLFTPALWLLVKDRKAVREWALRKVTSDPPAIVVPGHGPPVEAGDVAAQARAQLERL